MLCNLCLLFIPQNDNKKKHTYTQTDNADSVSGERMTTCVLYVDQWREELCYSADNFGGRKYIQMPRYNDFRHIKRKWRILFSNPNQRSLKLQRPSLSHLNCALPKYHLNINSMDILYCILLVFVRYWNIAKINIKLK